MADSGRVTLTTTVHEPAFVTTVTAVSAVTPKRLGLSCVSRQAVDRARSTFRKAGLMVKRPVDIGAFQFVVLSRLRAIQLQAGCSPRLAGTHTHAVMAQMEVADGQVKRLYSEEGDDLIR